MADGNSIFQIVGTAVGSIAASVLTAIASFKKRLDRIDTRTKNLRERIEELEKPDIAAVLNRLVELEKLFPDIVKKTGEVFDKAHAELDHNAREAVNRAVARATSSDLGAAKEAARQEAQAVVRLTMSQEVRHEVTMALAPIKREVDDLKRKVLAFKENSEKVVSSAEFAEHIANESDRWGEIQRSLGQIEGMIQTSTRR